MSMTRWVLGGFLVAPTAAQAQNAQVYVGLLVSVAVGRDPGIGGGLEVGSGVVWSPFGDPHPWGPVAGPFVRAVAQTAHPPSVTVGARAGLAAPVSTDCLGYFTLYEADAVVGWRFASRRSAVRIGASVASLVGVLDVLTSLPPAERLDPEIALGLRAPVFGGCQSGRPVRDPEGAMVLPTASTADGEAAEWLLAAEEEAGHALLCAAMAARRGGRTVAVGPMPVPAGVHGAIPLRDTSWVDGVLGEGRAAEEARERSFVAADPTAAAVERRIAREEAGHARLSADVLGWLG